jgi:hypothetical protein
MSDEELLADSELATDDNVKKSLSTAIGDWAKLDAEATTLGARMKEIADEMSAMKMKTLPDLLSAFGSLSFTDEATGLMVSLEMLVVGSVVKKDLEKRAAQLKYLAAMGGESLIRTSVAVDFDRGDAEKARQFIDSIKALGAEPNISESVNAASLCAWGRDKLESGAELDFPAVGLAVIKIAEPRIPVKRTQKVRTRK